MNNSELAACYNKDPLTAEQAHAVEQRMKKKGRDGKAFKCKFCGHWHIGDPKLTRKSKP